MKKVLVVEDDERLSLALSIRLKAQGYATWTAGDAISALSLALRVNPNLILLDISLPAGGGFAFIEQLNQFPGTREIPIVLSTASKDPELRDRALDLGVAGVLRKPYDAKELLAVVEHTLNNWDPDSVTYGLAETDQTGHGHKRCPKKVLIVEDDEKLTKALAIRLGAAGFETAIAHDGLTGVRYAVTNKPDLIVLDVSLPAGDGFTVAERIQTQIHSPTRIIFMTASNRPDFRVRAEQLGAAAFFEKPYEPEALLTAVRQVLG
jgi:DNA-binding response OmpR family regulator